MKRIYFIVPYPSFEAPSQRFRFEQYYDILDNHGFSYQVSSFFSLSSWNILYKPGNFFLKAWYVMLGFTRRINDLFIIPAFDIVFIHREAAPIGPPVIEWIIANLLRKKIIYDFDDAIWYVDRSSVNKLALYFKYPKKVKSICTLADTISVGNSYLGQYATRFNTNVIINPTTVPQVYEKPRKPGKILVIGWTGTHSTLQYLKIVQPSIVRLATKYNILFNIIANQPPDYSGWKGVNINFVQWGKATEIEDLSNFDIGIMPLYDNEWTRGKCGFKALQYMALGIPVVASPVGFNMEIMEQNRTGLFANHPDEWYWALESLIQDEKMRMRLGSAGKDYVSRNYTKTTNTENFLNLFRARG